MNCTRRGKIYLWYTPRDGYHLSADEVGCDCLLEHIDAAQVADPEPTIITKLDLLTLEGKASPVNSIQFNLDPGQIEDVSIIKYGVFHVAAFSLVGLQRFRVGVVDLQQGKGEWALVGRKKSILWFRPLAVPATPAVLGVRVNIRPIES